MLNKLLCFIGIHQWRIDWSNCLVDPDLGRVYETAVTCRCCHKVDVLRELENDFLSDDRNAP